MSDIEGPRGDEARREQVREIVRQLVGGDLPDEPAPASDDEPAAQPAQPPEDEPDAEPADEPSPSSEGEPGG